MHGQIYFSHVSTVDQNGKNFYTFIYSSLYQMFTYVDNSFCSGKTCGVSFEKTYFVLWRPPLFLCSSIPEKDRFRTHILFSRSVFSGSFHTLDLITPLLRMDRASLICSRTQLCEVSHSMIVTLGSFNILTAASSRKHNVVKSEGSL